MKITVRPESILPDIHKHQTEPHQHFTDQYPPYNTKKRPVNSPLFILILPYSVKPPVTSMAAPLM